MGIGRWLSHLQIMAIGCGKRIGGIKETGHLFCRDIQQTAQHPSHLLLRGRTIARDGHLDFQRGVFMDGNIAMDGSGDGYPLCPAEFQH